MHKIIFLGPKVILLLLHALLWQLVATDEPHLSWTLRFAHWAAFLALLTCWGRSGNAQYSLPAGMSSLSLLNSKQDVCSPHTGTDASGWLQENAVKAPCCDACYITHLSSWPLEKHLFHPSAKRTE